MKNSLMSGKNCWGNEMRFSILIPVYNSEKYIEECLQSIFNQTIKDYQVVLVDDGSTDNSGKICDSYKSKYPETVKVIHQKNQGQLNSRCNAIEEADGEYCIFMDADDLIVEDALEILNTTLKKFNSPDMIIYSFYYENDDGSIRKADKLFDDETVFDTLNKKELYKLFITGTGLNNVWTKAVKRSIFDDINFDFKKYSKIRCSEDRLHSMYMIDTCKTIVFKDTPIYRYRLFDGSVTRRFTVENIEKFKITPIYQDEKDFLYNWKLELPEWKYRLDAQWVQYAFYVFDLFYKNVSKKERKQVMSYDWCSFLDKESLSGIDSNPYLNDTYKKLWNWIINKNYSSLKLYFLKKKLRKILKK